MASLGLRRGLRCASPDYETTSQQDNEQGFAGASPDYETTSNRFAKATLSFADNETTSQQDNKWGGITELWNYGQGEAGSKLMARSSQPFYTFYTFYTLYTILYQSKPLVL